MNAPAPRLLPKPASLYAPLRAFVAERLPRLRAEPISPQRHADLTALIYWFPKDDSFDPCEFALRQTWSVLGALPSVIVTNAISAPMAAFAEATRTRIIVEPRLVSGDIWSMSLDCIERLYTRFETRQVLIVQDDGWPVVDRLEEFRQYDFVGAPSVTPDFRERIADVLGITVLNGGFSLRSRRLCKAASWRYRTVWRHFLKPGDERLSEDIFYTRTLVLRDPWYRLRFRWPSARVARSFSEDDLNGALALVCPGRMGHHGLSTFRALHLPLPRLTVVSAVRDWACYERHVRQNPFLRGATFVPFDNTQENLSIPTRYNSFLEQLPAETEWVIFAHEDLELLEDPRPALQAAYPMMPYGLIGTRFALGVTIQAVGHIIDSRRDGSGARAWDAFRWMETYYGCAAEAVDCCALFVHRSALEAFDLRFDQKLPWDLYVEDLCYQFRLRTGHLVRTLPVRAQHFSQGCRTSEHFCVAKDYLQQKYANYGFAGGTCCETIGQTFPWTYRLYRALKHALSRP